MVGLVRDSPFSNYHRWQEGDRGNEIYSKTDSASTPNTWTVTGEAIEEVTLCSEDYTHVLISNYDDEGQTGDIYLRSTEIGSPDEGAYECDGTECRIFRDGPDGLEWTCGDTLYRIDSHQWVTVPYGGPYWAIVISKHDLFDEPGLPYWYGYNFIVPGFAMVKEIDYWTDNPPTIQELADIQIPSVPSLSPVGMALLGGLVLAIAVGGLAVQRRRRAG